MLCGATDIDRPDQAEMAESFMVAPMSSSTFANFFEPADRNKNPFYTKSGPQLNASKPKLP